MAQRNKINISKEPVASEFVLSLSKSYIEQGMKVVHHCNPSTQRAKVGAS
jgi:hypothetical protein